MYASQVFLPLTLVAAETVATAAVLIISAARMTEKMRFMVFSP
jgi:hypothetical protein